MVPNMVMIHGRDPNGLPRIIEVDAAGRLYSTIIIPAGTTVGLDAGVNSVGTIGLDAGVNNVGIVGLAAGVNNVGIVGLAAGVNNIGLVGLLAGVASIGTVGLNAGANNIGDVDVLTIAAGETHIGQMGSESVTIVVHPAVTAGIYAADDCVGGAMEFTNASRLAGGGGVIKNLLVVDDAGQDAQMELWLFDQTFTSPGDNAPWVATEADLHNLVAIITSTDGSWFDGGTPHALAVEVSQQYTCAATSLFGQLVTRGTPTFAAIDDVSVVIGLLQD